MTISCRPTCKLLPVHPNHLKIAIPSHLLLNPLRYHEISTAINQTTLWKSYYRLLDSHEFGVS